MPESLKWDGEKYDCKPGLAGWKKFKELLVTNSARADKAGFSLTNKYVLAEAHVPLEAAVSVRRQPGTGSNSYGYCVPVLRFL